MATKTGTDSGSVFSETGGSRTIQRSKGSVVRGAVTRFGTVGAFIVMIIYFEIASSGLMLRAQNIGSILNQSAPLGLLSIGLTLCLILGLFDLSIGYTGTLAGMVCTGLMLNQGVAWPVALVATLVMGALIGLINGFIVTVLRVNALVATLAIGSVISGVLLWYSIAPFIGIFPQAFLDIGESSIFPWLPVSVLVFAGVALLMWTFLEKTPTGRRMYAVGGNEEAARIAGVRIKLMQVVAFVVCGLCASGSGVVLAAQLGSGQPTGEIGLLLSAFAAAFLGSATWREGEFHIMGTVIGVLILNVVFSGLALTNAPYWLKYVITGIVLILAVAMGSSLRSKNS